MFVKGMVDQRSQGETMRRIYLRIHTLPELYFQNDLIYFIFTKNFISYPSGPCQRTFNFGAVLPVLLVIQVDATIILYSLSSQFPWNNPL